MRLPNAEYAVIERVKLQDYCLNEQHPRGRHKARVFAAALGLTIADAEWLRERLLLAAQTEDATPMGADEYGARYVLDVTVTTQGGTATIRTAWIIRTGEPFPRLTTCFVL